MRTGKRGNKSKKFKLLVMVILLLIDLAMNSSFDYDSYNNNTTNVDLNFPLVLLGLQIVIEISIFLTLFLVMADTFLFRVGLLGLLLSKFWHLLILHPIYIAFTISAGSYRAKKLINGHNLTNLWNDSTFFTLSVLHKCVAVLYYLFNLRATIQLGDKKYLERTEWISLVTVAE
eukprot:gene1552-2999_t